MSEKKDVQLIDLEEKNADEVKGGFEIRSTQTGLQSSAKIVEANQVVRLGSAQIPNLGGKQFSTVMCPW